LVCLQRPDVDERIFDILQGTSSIVDEVTHEPLLSILSTIVETACSLQKTGHRVVIVSSGAIGMALGQMNLPRRPKQLPQVQALAALGQCKLIALWDQLFAHRNQPIAQILLTRNDIADRTQYLNAQNTFTELLNMGIIPIVNENDTLSVAEIKFGDNDTLSAITAAMVQADYLFLMTDVDCLYDKNPRTNPDAKPIQAVEKLSDLVADVSSAGSAVGTGGMSTKITAARLATSAGVTTVIARSNKPGNLASIVAFCEAQKGKSPTQSVDEAASETEEVIIPPLHTRFLPDPTPIRDRHFWLLYGLQPHGTVYIDAGAHRALSNKAGMLPVGVVDVEGSFGQQEAVKIVVVNRLDPASFEYSKTEPEPFEVGRALVNYSSAEIRRIRGLKSSGIQEVLGYADSEYIALRENIAFFNKKSDTEAMADIASRSKR